MKINIFIIFILFSFHLIARTPQVRTDAFLVKIYDERVVVTSPIKEKKDINVIVENKTLNKIVGKVETQSGVVLGFVSLMPKKFQSVSLKGRGSEKVYFVPLSPSFQKVILKFNNKVYEIPPKE